MRDILPIIGTIFGIIAVLLSIYNTINERSGARKKEMATLNEKISEHEGRIAATERITKVVEEFSEDLLLESLKSKRRRP